MTAPILVWLRRDLRLADNPALCAAAQAGPVALVFVDDPADGRPLGAAARWWLHHSLERLGPVTIARGPATEELPRLAAGAGTTTVMWNRSQDPALRATEDSVATACAQAGLATRAWDADTLFGADGPRTRTGGPFQVFTPFWRAAQALPPPPRPLPIPARLDRVALPGPALTTLDLVPRRDWWRGIAAAWTPGEVGAQQRLDRFLAQRLDHYHQRRDLAALPATSALSAHLAFGEISARQVWHAVTALPPGDAGAAFLRQLAWREFSRLLLKRHPGMATVPLRPDYAAFPWSDDAPALRRWQSGRTGFPIVDAGMRQLWATGWMHNRVRMIVASFLSKDLLIGWRHGEEWFWDTLVDADHANNTVSWQWVAGCGADAQPFFRIFNPVTQGEKFDPDGAYVRRWVPELARLAPVHIHSPWKAGGVPGYPAPMVDHGRARARALAALAGMKGEAMGG